MKYTMSWLIDKRVIFIVLQDELEVEEFRKFMIDLTAMVNEGTAPVHAVVDVRQITSAMHNMNGIGKVFADNRPQSNGFTILIGGNPVTRFFVQIFLSIAKLEVRFVKDMDEGMKVLYRVDINLPKTIPNAPSFTD